MNEVLEKIQKIGIVPVVVLDDAKDAPFSALTTVTREQITEKYEYVEKMLKTHII